MEGWTSFEGTSAKLLISLINWSYIIFREISFVTHSISHANSGSLFSCDKKNANRWNQSCRPIIFSQIQKLLELDLSPVPDESWENPGTYEAAMKIMASTLDQLSRVCLHSRFAFLICRRVFSISTPLFVGDCCFRKLHINPFNK